MLQTIDETLILIFIKFFSMRTDFTIRIQPSLFLYSVEMNKNIQLFVSNIFRLFSIFCILPFKILSPLDLSFLIFFKKKKQFFILLSYKYIVLYLYITYACILFYSLFVQFFLLRRRFRATSIRFDFIFSSINMNSHSPHMLLVHKHTIVYILYQYDR